jgi:hypothetical protein
MIDIIIIVWSVFALIAIVGCIPFLIKLRRSMKDKNEKSNMELSSIQD